MSQYGAPVQIFIHGGAWRNFTKDDYFFVADSLVPYGVHTVLVNFSKLPAARLPDVADQVRRAIKWVHRNAIGFGSDSGRLFVCAQSSALILPRRKGVGSAPQTDPLATTRRR
ncbi:MAG: alpha/beta hydrolase [Xanthobacteraceae bacterium]